MNKYICEFSGTFFLVLTVGSRVINGTAGVIGSLDIGSMLMLLLILAITRVAAGHSMPKS